MTAIRTAPRRAPRRAAGEPALRPAATVVVALLVAALAGCASRAPAPVVERGKAPAAPVAPAPAPRPAAPPPSGPVGEPEAPAATYTVKRGDTLHAIALDHGLDYRELAGWNNIENPNLIRVGQVLRLTAPGETGAAAPGAAAVTTMPLRRDPPVTAGEIRPAPSGPAQPLAMPATRNADNYKASPKAIKEPYSDQALREVQQAAAATAAAAPPPAAAPAATATPTPVPPAVAAAAPAKAAPAPVAEPTPPLRPDVRAPARSDDGEIVDWVWPTAGPVVTPFSETATLKGLDIAGKAGQPVVASAGGKVVYAGTGLRGYGKLVIVKHNATYLSAYAHNREILVKEGQLVARGQKIAEMGNTDADQVKLHFEIRKRGKPVDPQKFLPPA